MTIVFDAGGVLLWWKPEQTADEAFPDPEIRSRFFSQILAGKLWKLYDAGMISTEEIIRRAEQEEGIPGTQMRRFLDIARDALSPDYRMIALAEELLAAGHRLYVLSNMPYEFADYLKNRYDFWEKFHGTVFSGYIGKAKPDREIFSYLIASYQLVAEETVFIDDTAGNIESAESLGFLTVYFQDALTCRECLKTEFSLLESCST